MSASHRSIARLPLEIFTDLRPEQEDAGEALKCQICTKLKQRGKATEPVTTVGELLKLSVPTLLQTLDPLLTHVECQEFIRRISLYCAPSPISALELLHGTPHDEHSIRYLPTGMTALDSILRGGIACGNLSELVGRAGVGKSQLALQLCIIAAKYNKASIYIDTEQKLSIARLQEMASNRHEHSSSLSYQDSCSNPGAFSYGGGGTSSSIPSATTQGGDNIDTTASDFYGDDSNIPFKTARQVLANVTVCTAANTRELLEVVQTIEEQVFLKKEQARHDANIYPVRLIVLDSIAAPTRRDFGSERAPQRVSAMLQLAQILKRLANQLQLAIVVINQVGLEDNTTSSGNENGTDFVTVKAAMGTAWSHCLSTRLLLEHERDPHRLGTTDNAGGMEDDWNDERGRVRKATVVKSNVAGQESMQYEIGIAGLHEIHVERDGE